MRTKGGRMEKVGGEDPGREFGGANHQDTGEAQAVGVVTGHENRRYPSGSVLVHPLVRFTTPDGRTVEFESSVGSNAPPRVGEEVPVFYDPSRPAEARIAAGSAIRSNPKVLLVVGAVFLGLVLLFFLLFVAAILLVSL